MYRVLLLLTIFATVACEEQTRVVGASPSVLQTATTAGPPTSSVTPTATRTAATTSAPPTAAGTTPPPTPTSSVRTATPAPTPTGTPQGPHDNGTPPGLGACADEGAVRPSGAGASVPIVFSNQSGSTLDYLSLDAQGRRVLARSLGGGSYTQTAHVGDVWIVSRAGTCVALYSVTAAALLISQPTRQSLIPLYAIAGIISDGRGSALSGQTVFIWQPEESACSVLGGSESPGYVVSSITGPDGRFIVYVTPGSYKIRVRATTGYASQWWSGKPAGSAGQCAAADVVTVTGDTLQVNFTLPPQ